MDDALRVTRWMQGQPFVDRSRLGLLGTSLGGLVGACVCGQTDVYRDLVQLAPTTVDNLTRHAQRRMVDGRVVLAAHMLHEKFFDDLQSLDPLREVVKHPKPTLIVQGTSDDIVLPAVSQAYADAMTLASLPVSYERIDNADHTFSHPAWRQQLLRRIVPWLGSHLTL